MKNFTPIFLILLFFSCKKENATIDLQQYIHVNSEFAPLNELIACAAGGQVGFLDDENFPLSIFFYPLPDAIDFKYYETQRSSDDPNDLSLFLEKEKISEPLFNGFLRRFPLPQPDKDVWSRVSFIANDTLWYSKAIHLKTLEKPSQYKPGFCQVNLTDPLSPIFTWEDEMNNDNIIYFQIVSDENDNALSGTYTTEQNFQFYDLGNVVLNVTPPNTTPTLTSGNNYNFTLMGVGGDNWVNLIMDKNFVAQ